MTRVSESMYLHEITDDDLALLSKSHSSAATRVSTLSNSTKESKRNSRSRKRGFSESESESTSLQDDDIHDEESESIGSNAEECVETTEEDEMSKVHADSIVKEGMESLSSENQDDIVPKKKTSKRHNSAVASDNDTSHRDLVCGSKGFRVYLENSFFCLFVCFRSFVLVGGGVWNSCEGSVSRFSLKGIEG